MSPEKEQRNRGYDRFFTRVLDDRSIKHEVERNLALLSVVQAESLDDRLEAWLSAADLSFARRTLAPPEDGLLVALGPGAGSPNRVWPIGRYVELGRRLTAEGARLLLVGGPGEEAMGDALHQRLGDRAWSMGGDFCGQAPPGCLGLLLVLRQRCGSHALGRGRRYPGC